MSTDQFTTFLRVFIFAIIVGTSSACKSVVQDQYCLGTDGIDVRSYEAGQGCFKNDTCNTVRFRATLDRTSATVTYNTRIRMPTPEFYLYVYFTDDAKFKPSKKAAKPMQIFYMMLTIRGPPKTVNKPDTISTKGTSTTVGVDVPTIPDSDNTTVPNPEEEKIRSYSCETVDYNATEHPCYKDLNVKNLQAKAVNDDGLTIEVTFDTPVVLKFEPASLELNLETKDVIAYIVVINEITNEYEPPVTDQIVTMKSHKRRLLFDGMIIDVPPKQVTDNNTLPDGKAGDGKIQKKKFYLLALLLGAPTLIVLIACLWMAQKTDLHDKPSGIVEPAPAPGTLTPDEVVTEPTASGAPPPAQTVETVAPPAQENQIVTPPAQENQIVTPPAQENQTVLPATQFPRSESAEIV